MFGIASMTRSDWVASLVAAVFAMVWTLPLNGFASSIFFGAAIAVLAASALKKYKANLESRDADWNSAIWTVRWNGVDAGSISDREFSRLRLVVFNLESTYFQQARNFGMAYWRVSISVGRLFVNALILLVVGLELLRMLTPELYFPVLSAIPVAAMMRACFDGSWVSIVELMLLAMHATVLFAVVLKYPDCLSNVFKDKTRRAVRLHLKILTDGEMQLVRHDADGKLHVLDERKFASCVPVGA